MQLRLQLLRPLRRRLRLPPSSLMETPLLLSPRLLPRLRLHRHLHLRLRQRLPQS
jgi:hypothetical protein